MIFFLLFLLMIFFVFLSWSVHISYASADKGQEGHVFRNVYLPWIQSQSMEKNRWVFFLLIWIFRSVVFLLIATTYFLSTSWLLPLLFFLLFLFFETFQSMIFPQCFSNHFPYATSMTTLSLILTYPLLLCVFLVLYPSHKFIHALTPETKASASPSPIPLSWQTFQNRLAKEIMVPRIDLCCLSLPCSIQEAVSQIHPEGFSRIPVYKDSIDHIIGVVLWKDLLSKYIAYASAPTSLDILHESVESIIRPALFIPEGKKITEILKELQKKQVHLAIVVNEYGRTEGIVTLEDILEELVGEIDDELDEGEQLYTHAPQGGYVVLGHMSVYDIQEQLKISIPQQGSYNTIGGYVFHCVGKIPPEGFVIQHDHFTCTVIRATDRCIEKVHIQPSGNHQMVE